MAVRHSVERLDQADVYSPGAGRITRLTSHKFPILNVIQMSAVRVDLYQVHPIDDVQCALQYIIISR